MAKWHRKEKEMKGLRSSLNVILVLVVILAATACARPQSSAKPASGEGATYTIGFIAAITGRAASLGEPERDAAMLMQKQLDAQGGIVGPDGVKHPVKILIHDTEGSGDIAVPLVKKLINDSNVVAIIGPTTSPVSMALIPVAQEAQVTMFSMASSSQIVEPVADRKWVFKSAQSNKHTAPWQVRYAKEKGLLKIANFYANDAYGEDGRNGIRDAAKAGGLTIVLEETFGAADTDMTAQLTKLKASGAQALLVTAIPPAASILTKQFREMGLTIPIIHNHGIGMKTFIDLCGAAEAEGVIFPMGKMVAARSLPASDPQKKVLVDFMEAYEKSSGKPPSTFAGHAWDALQIVLHGLEKLPNGLTLQEQRVRLRDQVEQTKGLVGTAGVFNLSAQDHVGLSADDVVMARITKGDWEYFPPDKW
jgi:branched-chain amino acid transport system substrate-binding protein